MSVSSTYAASTMGPGSSAIDWCKERIEGLIMENANYVDNEGFDQHGQNMVDTQYIPVAMEDAAIQTLIEEEQDKMKRIEKWVAEQRQLARFMRNFLFRTMPEQIWELISDGARNN